MRKRRFFRILLGTTLACLTLLFLLLLFERLRGQISLARYRQQLRARGEKLTPAELQPPVPEGQNGAPEIFAAVQQLQQQAMLPKPMPPRMELLPSGHAVVGFRESQWSAESTNYWGRLATELEASEGALKQIRAGLDKPFLNNNLDYSAGFHLPLEHLSAARSLAYWFGAETQLALHDDRRSDALNELMVQVRLLGLLAEDHLLASEQVRLAMVALARNGTWEALQATNWTDDDLARLQALWEKQNFVVEMAASLEGERVYDEASYELLRASNEDTARLLIGPEGIPIQAGPHRPAWEQCLAKIPGGDSIADFLKRQVYCRVWRFAWSRQDELQSLERMQDLIDIVRAASVRKSWADLRPQLSAFEKRPLSKGWYDALRHPDSGSDLMVLNGLDKAMRAETERSILVTAIAIRRHALRQGGPPPSLDALVPEFLATMPIDYMDGQPIRYRALENGGFVLYSVGADGQDNGGDAAPLSERSGLRNLWDRRDFVWPAPASPEETEAYRVEAAKN